MGDHLPNTIKLLLQDRFVTFEVDIFQKGRASQKHKIHAPSQSSEPSILFFNNYCRIKQYFIAHFSNALECGNRKLQDSATNVEL